MSSGRLQEVKNNGKIDLMEDNLLHATSKLAHV